MVKRMTFKQFLFILPLLVFIGIFSIYPIVVSFMYTFFDYHTNDQQYNGFYMSQKLNGKLFSEDCGYVSYFIDTDKMTEGLSEEDIAEFEAIQAEAEAMEEKYSSFGDVSKVSEGTMNEVIEFTADISERLTALYEKMRVWISGMWRMCRKLLRIWNPVWWNLTLLAWMDMQVW